MLYNFGSTTVELLHAVVMSVHPVYTTTRIGLVKSIEMRHLVFWIFLFAGCHGSDTNSYNATDSANDRTAELVVKLEALVTRIENHEALLSQALELLNDIAANVEELRGEDSPGEEVGGDWPGKCYCSAQCNPCTHG
jgi:hypothetical protein